MKDNPLFSFLLIVLLGPLQQPSPLEVQDNVERETLSIKYLRRAVIIYNLRKQKENGNLKDGT